MKSIILLACAIACIIALKGPEPPLWPETFSQDFVLGEKAQNPESGKTWMIIRLKAKMGLFRISLSRTLFSS